MPDHDDVIEAIYEASVRPEHWEEALRQVAEIVGCGAGALSVEHRRAPDLSSAVMFGYEPGSVEALRSHYWSFNPMLAWSGEVRPGQLLTNSMVLPTSEFRRTKFYNEWAGPQGFGDALTLWVDGAAETFTTLTLPRPERLGEFTSEDVAVMGRLARHLGRALRVAHRVRSAEARVAGYAEGSGVLHSPMILLDGRGRVADASPTAEALLREADLLRVALDGRLMACSPGVDDRLQRALPPRRLREAPSAGTVEIDVPTARGTRQISVAAVPRPDVSFPVGAERSKAGIVAAVVVVSEPLRLPQANTQVATLIATCDLTPAEARLVTALVDDPGGGLPAAAGRVGVALTTARTHLAHVFSKTGTRRQAELIHLVARLAPERR